jgi:hypothetical protein
MEEPSEAVGITYKAPESSFQGHFPSTGRMGALAYVASSLWVREHPTGWIVKKHLAPAVVYKSTNSNGESNGQRSSS